MHNDQTYFDFHECIQLIKQSKERYNPNLKKRAPSSVETSLQSDVAILIQNKFRCVSLSKGSLNALMFAHYADSYRGVCLVFENNDYFRQAHKVQYKGYYQQTFVGFVRGVKTIVGAYTRKKKEWQYECEYRLLKKPNEFLSLPLSNLGYLDAIPEGSLKGIIMGCRISKGNKDILISLKQKHVITADLYTSEIHQNGINIKLCKV